MYEVGTLILYGRTGVCRVEGVEEQVLRAGEAPEQFYILKPLYQSCNISTPVENPRVFSRPIISRDEVDALIAKIPEVEAEPYYNRNLNQLREHYRECIECHTCEGLIAMTKGLYLKRREAEAQKKKFGAVDERFLREAEDLLFGEFAAALNIERNAVTDYIAERMGPAFN